MFEASDLEVIKLFSRSTQLSMKFFLLINVKMSTIISILTFMSRENNILGNLSLKKPTFTIFLYLRALNNLCSAELSMIFLYNPGVKFLLCVGEGRTGWELEIHIILEPPGPKL